MSDQTTAHADNSLTLDQRRAFMKLPLVERRRQMAQQADRMLEHYEAKDETAERKPWQGGDIVEC